MLTKFVKHSIQNSYDIFQLFADMERKRQHLEVRDMEERKRKREAEIEQETQVSLEKEWAKNFEVAIV